MIWDEVRRQVPGSFEFVVMKLSYDSEEPEVGGGWRVYLPHQCDEWCILGKGYVGERDVEKAVKEMKVFVKEATAALHLLESMVKGG